MITQLREMVKSELSAAGLEIPSDEVLDHTLSVAVRHAKDPWMKNVYDELIAFEEKWRKRALIIRTAREALINRVRDVVDAYREMRVSDGHGFPLFNLDAALEEYDRQTKSKM